MILMLSAEVESSGLWDYEQDIELPYNFINISANLENLINHWVKAYEPYTALPNIENINIRNSLEELDKEGINLLKQIAFQYKNPQKYYYYSVGKDKLEYVLYKDGTEKYFD
ncbi:MAG: hypothetical protein M3Q58_15570 [Bacteroidota bacterium]|nr:hypothetical protein [Bacteroidota bacterium]